jgi:hypothetical protein
MRNLPIEIPDDEIQPWHSLGGVEHICELRKSCTVLYGIFVELARLVYHTTDGRLIGTPEVVWKARNPSIWIDTELRWEDQHPEFRPAIYVQLSPMKYEEYVPGMNGKISSANRFAVRHYQQKVSGAVTFMHVASTVGEACALADNTDYTLNLMQAPICEDFCFTKFFLSERTPLEKLPDESTERYASGVTFSYEFEDAWDVTQESPILKSVDMLNSSRRATVDRDNILTETKISGRSR